MNDYAEMLAAGGRVLAWVAGVVVALLIAGAFLAGWMIGGAG